MDSEQRHRLAQLALAGYVNGPDAPIAAEAIALERAESARSLILVEGISDQIAVETLAARCDCNLASERVVVIPMGGAQAIARYLNRFGPGGEGLRISGLCDAGEEQFVRRGLIAAGVGAPKDRSEMGALGFFVCVEDLEEELIRAAGRELTESLLDSQGDLDSFRTLQKQPAWRDGAYPAQMRRFLGAGAKRKLRYASLLVNSIELDRMPKPLTEVLAR